MASRGVPDLTRSSSKGQVVTPDKVSGELGIKVGAVFAIVARPKAGLVVLKRIESESLSIDLKLLSLAEPKSLPSLKGMVSRGVEAGSPRLYSRSKNLENVPTT
jgi:bifunctional DNA-binding transcriptional regulator/antitoxin component of YhaV-PrlF toxin-antitoxin module